MVNLEGYSRVNTEGYPEFKRYNLRPEYPKYKTKPRYAFVAAHILDQVNSVLNPITVQVQEYSHILKGPDRYIWFR